MGKYTGNGYMQAIYGVDNNVWAIDHDNRLQYRSGMKFKNLKGDKWESVDDRKWLDVAGNYGGYHVFGIDTNFVVWYREGIEGEGEAGRFWSEINGKMKQVRLGVGHFLWGIDLDDRIV